MQRVFVCRFLMYQDIELQKNCESGRSDIFTCFANEEAEAHSGEVTASLYSKSLGFFNDLFILRDSAHTRAQVWAMGQRERILSQQTPC